MSFEILYKQESFQQRAQELASRTDSLQNSREAARVLANWEEGRPLELQDLLCLLAPGAEELSEEIFACARSCTKQRFGSTMQLYAPLYLSNYCHSTCTYCGFSRTNQIKRLQLKVEEALAEAQILRKQGIRHILLLTGEDYKNTPPAYLEDVISALSPHFASLTMEVYPMDTAHYLRLRSYGLDGVAVYQESYDPQRYKEVHLGGMKKRMYYRLNCPDRVGAAGIRRIAIGALLGLSDPAVEVFFLAMHAQYLMRQYWQSEISLSLPRLRPSAALGEEQVPYISDHSYAHYLCALRLFLPQAGLNLSTREAPHIRDMLADICITHMSAGSKTEPGGYSGKNSTKQFENYDKRSIREVSMQLKAQGLDTVFVDWSHVLNRSA